MGSRRRSALGIAFALVGAACSGGDPSADDGLAPPGNAPGTSTATSSAASPDAGTGTSVDAAPPDGAPRLDASVTDGAAGDDASHDAAHDHHAADAAQGGEDGGDGSTNDASAPDALAPDASIIDASAADASVPDASTPDARPGDASMGDVDSSDAAQPCISANGTGLPVLTFGRLDGEIVDVLDPTAMTCGSDAHHVHLRVRAGAVFDVAVNVESTVTLSDPTVAFDEVAASLAGPAWSEGWHSGVSLDYATTLGLHASDFTPTPIGTLSSEIEGLVGVGARVSIFGTAYSDGTGAHLIHRNTTGADGALVLEPTGAPRYLVFHFSDQTF
jgi:hypothetical protein